MTDVLVLGGGIVGLNTALRLASETDHKVTVWSANYLENTSSYSGAYWWPPPSDLEGEQPPAWALETLEFFQSLGTYAGITFRKLIALMEEPWEFPNWFSKIPNFREALKHELNAPFKQGLIIDPGPVIDPPAHLKWLREQLSHLDVEIETRQVSSLEEPLEQYSILVNCTGIGARELCNDTDLRPVSGQLVKIRTSNANQVTATGNLPVRTTYIIPHTTYTSLGGTYFENDWQTEPDENETKMIIERCNKLCPTLQATESDIIAITRGLRPVRSSVRVETEKRAKGVIIHNYGHGKSGFSLAFGSAGAAVRLINEL